MAARDEPRRDRRAPAGLPSPAAKLSWPRPAAAPGCSSTVGAVSSPPVTGPTPFCSPEIPRIPRPSRTGQASPRSSKTDPRARRGSQRIAAGVSLLRLRAVLYIRVIDSTGGRSRTPSLSQVEPDTVVDSGDGADRDGYFLAAPQVPFLEKHVGHVVVAGIDDESFAHGRFRRRWHGRDRRGAPPPRPGGRCRR